MVIRYPGNRTFAVCLTHDIDDVYPTWQHTLLAFARCLKKLNFRDFENHFLWRYKGKNHSPYLNFKNIMEMEERYGAKSTFYFMASEEDPFRFRYHIEDLKSRLISIVNEGWEIGLHGSYYAYRDPAVIQREKRRLEDVLGRRIIGYRNHYLKFQIPDTWEYLAQAGFKYDTTFGFNDAIGFRSGLYHPFQPYNPLTDSKINILEIPLNIMDSALLDLFKSPDQAWGPIKELVDTTEKCNGVLTVLWHNNSFNNPIRDGYHQLYERLLKYGRQKNAWMTSGEEIWRWWHDGHWNH